MDKIRTYFFISCILGVFSFFSLRSYAAVPTTQTAGGIEKTQEDIERAKKLEKNVLKVPETPKVEEKEKPSLGAAAGGKALIKSIVVDNVTYLKVDDIKKITSEYENKELSIDDMQKVADLITDAYRARGYPTSRAYIPPQPLGKDGVLKIAVVEGKVGDVSVTGNKYFKSSLYKKKLNLKQGNPFNYSSLQLSLMSINERPDRFAKAVLVPGKTPGSTDIIIEAKDRLPMHVGYTHDNYGSRYVGSTRQSFTFEDNNLLGFDDQLYLQYQISNHSLSRLENGRYLFPLNDTLDLGIAASDSKTKLGREFADLNSIGKATVLGIFVNKALTKGQNPDLRVNFGFDYKRIRNSLLDVETSRDDARVFKAGLDLDNSDKLGRTLFTTELDLGVPDMLGGLDAKDSRASIRGSGGRFAKAVFNLYRAQPMPFSSSLLFKNSAQYSNYTLTAAEEFQIGGPYSVRGYAPAEYAGDKGIFSSVEWSFPCYIFMPRKAVIPFTKEKWYDATRFVIFYDWATVHANNPDAVGFKHRELKGCGFGLRFNILNNLSAKAEFGYPIGRRSTDLSHQHLQPWVEFTCKL